MKSSFLPGGLVLAFLVAWLLPEAGVQLKDWGLIPWMVVTIFIVNGYQTNLSELPRSKSFVVAMSVTAVIALLVSPFIGLGVASVFGMGAGFTLGLVVKATVPPTLSTCIVMTQLAGGYGAWALIMTLALNIVGIFTIPFMLDLTLDGIGDIVIDPLPLLQKLMLLVLLPFLAGLGLRRIATIDPKHLALQYLPSTCVILTVWMALSDSSEVFQSLDLITLASIGFAALSVHLILLALCWGVSTVLKLEWKAAIAVILTGSQKTLPVAVSVLTALNLPMGEALLVCVLFHFLVLFGDALLVPYLKRPLIEQA